jgi:hypothetical protein
MAVRAGCDLIGARRRWSRHSRVRPSRMAQGSPPGDRRQALGYRVGRCGHGWCGYPCRCACGGRARPARAAAGVVELPDDPHRLRRAGLAGWAPWSGSVLKDRGARGGLDPVAAGPWGGGAGGLSAQPAVRRHAGKSDQIDAEAAARAVQAGAVLGRPKTTEGRVEMLRVLRVARRSAVKARTQAANQLHALVITAPDPLRGELRELGLARLVARAGRFRSGSCRKLRPQRPNWPCDWLPSATSSGAGASHLTAAG